MQESGSDVHQHKQALKDLEAKLVVSFLPLLLVENVSPGCSPLLSLHAPDAVLFFSVDFEIGSFTA